MSEQEEDEQLSAEDLKKVVRHFIKNASEGEQYIVAAKLKSLYPEFPAGELETALMDRAIKNCAVVGAPDCPTILSEMTCIEDKFYNPTTRKLYGVSLPLDGKGGAKLTEAEGTLPEQTEFVKAVQDNLDEYIKSNYTSESHAAGVVMGTDDDLKIMISADTQKVESYWDGTWVNTYTVSEQTLKGTIKLTLHYFESGNVMLTTEKTVEFPEIKKDDAADIIVAIKEVETKFQIALTEYLGKQSHAIKDVRRGLTVQGTKFDWRPGVHKVADSMA